MDERQRQDVRAKVKGGYQMLRETCDPRGVEIIDALEDMHLDALEGLRQARIAADLGHVLAKALEGGLTQTSAEVPL